MSNVGIYNLCIDKGATFGPIVFRLSTGGTEIDLTNLSARAKIRDSFTGSVLADLTCSIPEPTDGRIWVSLASNVALPDNISPLNVRQITDWATRTTPLTREQLKLFNVGTSPYVWDLETFDTADPPNVLRRLSGLVAITSEVTYDNS